MEKIDGGVVKRTEFPFPNDLDGRVNAISNVMNNPLKIATLLHLDDVLAEGSDILARIMESVGEDVRLTYGKNFGRYCYYSLLPIGTVAEEQVIRDIGEAEYVGYRITEDGKKYGIPLGVFSLEWEVDNNMSLYCILGPTFSTGKSRSPLRRIKILKLLRQEGILRQVDLVEKVKVNHSSIRGHLINLQKIGFVKYESIPEPHEGKGTYIYRFIGKQGRPKKIGTNPTLTRRVLEIMGELGEANHFCVSERLSCSNPKRISFILARLVKQGFLKRAGKFKIGEIQSMVKLSDSGSKFVDQYISVTEKALSDQPILNELSHKAEEFLDDDERKRIYLIRCIENYWKVSPRGNAKPREETNRRIIAYLEKNPGARRRDLRRDLGLSSGNNLTLLVNAEILEKRRLDDKNKTAVGYFVIK